MATPLDMNMFAASFPNFVDLHDQGRMVISVVPTASFGMLHSKLLDANNKEIKHLTQNDILKIEVPGSVGSGTGRKLVVVGWGPDLKWVAKTLTDLKLEATMVALPYMKSPNALVS